MSSLQFNIIISTLNRRLLFTVICFLSTLDDVGDLVWKNLTNLLSHMSEDEIVEKSVFRQLSSLSRNIYIIFQGTPYYKKFHQIYVKFCAHLDLTGNLMQ